MKIKYAVNNLRSIEKMEPVELRPITILIGKNNSGKSTFLRTFSLFKQSLEENTNEPMFWNGEYVDFGNFLTAVNCKDSNKEISFNFEFNDFKMDDDYTNFHPLVLDTDNNRVNNYFNKIKFEIYIKYNKYRSVLSKIMLYIYDYNIKFNIEFYENSVSSNIYIDDKLILESENGIAGMDYGKAGFKKYNNLNKINPLKFINNIFCYEDISIFNFSKIYDILEKFSSSYFKNKYENEEYFDSDYITDVAFYLLSLKLSSEQAIKELVNKTSDKKVKEFLNPLLNEKYSSITCEIYKICIVNLVNGITSNIISILQEFFRSTSSIGPSRVKIDRYNEEQAFSTTEILIDGRNFPMFLSSLEETELLDKFSEWIKGIIGYKISIGKGSNSSTKNISVNIVDEGLSVNVIDAGYGLSQLLPALAQIWLTGIQNTSSHKDSGALSMGSQYRPVTIEQPELHLHPEHQAQIADALVRTLEENVAEKQESTPLYIVETHSRALISRIGRKVRDGDLSEDDVQILVFDRQKDAPNSTKIKSVTFDSEGSLSNNWPYGFFNY